MHLKRGIGHVEVVVAFVLFIGFLIFGLYFFNPLDSTRLLDSTLFYAKKAVIDNASVSTLTYTIVLNNTVSVPVVSVPLERGKSMGNGFRVENQLGKAVDSAYDSGNIKFDRNAGYLFYVRFGDFESKSSEIKDAVPLTIVKNFTISSSDNDEIVSEAKLAILNASYYSDYDRVRTAFNLPRRTDFSVEVDLHDPENKIFMTREIPAGLDIASDKSRVEILRLDGSVSFADVIVKVW